MAAAASLSAERDQEQISDLQRLWLEEHKDKVRELGGTLNDIFNRLDGFGDEVQQRIESQEYLALVRKSFRAWDEADTHDKKQMLKKLITNAGAIHLCSDDLIRLFIGWIELMKRTSSLLNRSTKTKESPERTFGMASIRSGRKKLPRKPIFSATSFGISAQEASSDKRAKWMPMVGSTERAREDSLAEQQVRTWSLRLRTSSHTY